MQGSDLLDDFPDREALYEPEEWINDCGAVVIKPMGNIAADPLHRGKGILYSGAGQGARETGTPFAGCLWPLCAARHLLPLGRPETSGCRDLP